MSIKDAIKIDLKEQLKSLFDTGINLSIGQIGAIQWAINQVAISKTETTSCEWCDKTLMLFTKSGKYIPENQPPRNFCPNCGRKLKENE